MILRDHIPSGGCHTEEPFLAEGIYYAVVVVVVIVLTAKGGLRNANSTYFLTCLTRASTIGRGIPGYIYSNLLPYKAVISDCPGGLLNRGTTYVPNMVCQYLRRRVTMIGVYRSITYHFFSLNSFGTDGASQH